MLTTSTSDQWCISDEYTTSSNQSCHNIVFASYCIWFIKWWFFFFQLGIYMCRWIFINFMPSMIFIKLIFSNFAALAFDQWCICDDFGTFTNQFCCDLCFVSFFLGFIKDFFLFNLCKKLHLFVASH